MSTREIIYAAAGASGPATYIEDVFSTYLYTGNGTFSGETQAILNGINLATNGGMVWIKNRTSAGTDNCVSDTVRGGTSNMIRTNSTAAAAGAGSNISFQTTGFTCLTSGTNTNYTGERYASWTFREQPKFFDVVTYTGDGNASKTISHNLGSTPGMVIVKKTNATSNWIVWAKVSGVDKNLRLNTTGAATSDNWIYNVTSTQFVAAYDFGAGAEDSMNDSGATYVAYLFAHNAGGFGTSGTDNVISCGSYTYSGGANPQINLGFEPQWVMRKRSDSTSNWEMVDIMRGMPNNTANPQPALQANLLSAESSTSMYILPTATGFIDANCANSSTYIYMAIRRGPMKTPTSGTSVFSPIATSASTGTTQTTNFPIDLQFFKSRNDSIDPWYWVDRLRGVNSPGLSNSMPYLRSDSPTSELTSSATTDSWNNTGFNVGGVLGGVSTGYFSFRRAPGFFDEVCYTGTGSTPQNITHNLGVAPELMIVKVRTALRAWAVYAGNAGQYLTLNATDAVTSNTNVWGNTAPTSSVFRVGNFSSTNPLGEQIVAYLFATVAGVSKVGSYTGTGSTQTINAGLPTGARFVLIKRTDSTGSWWVWDTARGMVAGTDPRLALNSTAAEVNNNWVYTVTNGFQIVTSDATVNASGGSYIYLAIA